jgi:L-lactate dehydrogenase
VLGEHGDSEVLSWSLVTVGGVPLEDFCKEWNICTDDEVRERITQGVKQAAYRIIEGKGSTNFGIGSALARIVQVILGDQRSLLTVCTPVAEVTGVEDVTISLPHLIGGEGILDTVPLPLALNKAESEALRASAKVVKRAFESLAFDG